ncbi:ring-cleaving dioxygenase [Halobacterium sp. KA-6]|uniref:ring-cleaving dioxygenase n=1 Tax=Halobacterium sp. KA-6 TaxID=2896368 RepID=UPI001E3B3A59|nr:ring-cleaving dioxygenase [Halobacterium sp. KA-6]MCD2204044.1 ring-cleaving dioxygenase [Halobacterium sp. KA-6]
MREQSVPGLHHVTAVASDPQHNAEFYTQVLGFRLVKRTVNFDDPTTYHLYYGNETGAPGALLTFFPFGTGYRGQIGRGQPVATAFTIPDGAVQYWIDRLDAHDVNRGQTEERFGRTVIPFKDSDGQPLELVTGPAAAEPWCEGPVAPEHALRGIHGVTLLSADLEATERILAVLGYEQRGRESDRIRYSTPGDPRTVVDLLDRPGAAPGRPGAGTVHHVAFRTANEDTQAAWRERLSDMDLPLRVTRVKNRQYFKSIYFREPGGILLEIATDGPGFERDEARDSLGTALKLPPSLETERDRLEAVLPDLSVGTHPD